VPNDQLANEYIPINDNKGGGLPTIFNGLIITLLRLNEYRLRFSFKGYYFCISLSFNF